MVLDDEVDNFCETITAKGDENTNEIKRDKMIVNQWVEHYLIRLALKAVYNRITGFNQIVEHIFDVVQPRVFSRKFQSRLPTIFVSVLKCGF